MCEHIHEWKSTIFCQKPEKPTIEALIEPLASKGIVGQIIFAQKFV
jgi:hypothetical protein